MSPQRLIRVLVVENNVQAVKTFRKLLSLIENVEVIDFLTTAQEALDIANEVKPDVMLVEEHLPDIDGISFTEIVRRDYPTTQVIIVSQDKHYDTVLRALRNGASDFLAHDVSIGEFREAILRGGELAAIEKTKYHPYLIPDLNRPEEGTGGPKAKVISVYSPRGGCGVTTIANNLALSFRDNESQIALVDSNLQFGDVDILFNELGQLSLLDLTPIAFELDQKVVKEVMILHRTSGLFLLASPKHPAISEPISGEQVSRVMDYLRNFYSYVVINTSSYLNEASLAALDASDIVVLVVTQEIAGIKSMRAFIEMWESFGLKRDRLMLVVNKFKKSNALTARKIADTLTLTVELAIPEDYESALRAANLGNPLLMSNPNADISQAIVELSERIKKKIPTVEMEGRFRLFAKQ
jgi:pilus assembly protein CpaE